MNPSPHALYEKTGGGDAYRIAMLEHGYVVPTAPWERRLPGSGRMLQCGNIHDFNWSDWRRYEQGDRVYEGRWCLTCGTTQAREEVADVRCPRCEGIDLPQLPHAHGCPFGAETETA